MKAVYNIISSYDLVQTQMECFFNINKFSDDCIQSLVDFTHEKGQEKEGVKLEYTTYNHEEHKDKVIIKKNEKLNIIYWACNDYIDRELISMYF